MQPWQNRIESKLNWLNKILVKWPWLTFAILMTLSVLTLVVLPGCGGKQVIVQPAPSLPLPPADLMKPPRNQGLVPNHLRPPALKLNAMPPATPSN